MKPIRRILLVLKAPLLRTPALERAAAVARAAGAQLWLGLYDRGPRLGAIGLLDRAEAARLEGLMRDQESERLAELRQELLDDGLPGVEIVDDRETLGATRVLDDVARLGIDLLIKDVGHESLLRRLVFLPLDWELLRNCPIPSWFVGTGAQGLPRRIVAAVDPVHPEHGAGALNTAILDMARAIEILQASHIRVFSAFTGLPAGLRGLDPMGASIGLPHETLYEQLRVEHRSAFERLLQHHGLPDSAAIVLYGPAAYSVLDALQDVGADVLVVGVPQRHGIDRWLLGSTVERLVGEAPCDLVTVPAVVAGQSTASAG